MTQNSPGQEQYGDSAASVSPDTQYADPTEPQAPEEPADTEDASYAAGTADAEPPDEEPEEDPDAPDPQGTSADTVSDGPDKESGFYG